MTPASEKLRCAPFFPRAAAFLLDRLILGVVLFIPRITLVIRSMRDGALTRAVLFRFTPGEILLWVLVTAYFVVFTACIGATPGKKAMGLAVVTTEGAKPSFLTVLCRETFGRYLSSILCIGYLLCAVDPENGALHDRICDTRVVYALKDGSVSPPPRQAAAPAVPAIPAAGGEDWYAPNR